VSRKLVQSWEQGDRRPSRGELRLIELLMREPEIVSNLILGGGRVESAARRASHRKVGSKAGPGKNAAAA
jgi:hypothetical protein